MAAAPLKHDVWERGRSSLAMCYQCTLLGPLIAVEGK
eukprot:COSAG04_NODE_17599_length_464_cov_1.065753_1_plen_36_part_10